MAPRALPLALGLLATALLSCGGSGLDVETPLVFQGDPAGAFGTTVAQFGTSDDGWVLVGAPLERGGADETGAVYRCRFQSGRCQKVPVAGPPGAVNASLGLALAAGDGGVLACGPTSPQACGVNVHLNGFCVHLDSALQPLRRLPDAFPECPKSSMDIAFLIDGSGSIAPHEFNAMKTFIVEVMKRFQGADVQFSLTQFSSRLQDHFYFSTFRDHPDPALLLRSVQQLRGPTHTATAILHVLQRMFLPDRGARAGARRILIVVTDGEKYGDNLSYSDVIPLAESMAVTRYAIGVGSAFLKPNAQAELREIASSPARDHVFRVDNFGALGDIQNQLQEKIFAIEGTQSAHSSSFQLEMAQEGFSALVTPEGPVLGAVGAYDWSGGVFVYGGGGAPTFVNVSRDLGNLGNLGDLRDMDDAYLGGPPQTLPQIPPRLLGCLAGPRGLAGPGPGCPPLPPPRPRPRLRPRGHLEAPGRGHRAPGGFLFRGRAAPAAAPPRRGPGAARGGPPVLRGGRRRPRGRLRGQREEPSPAVPPDAAGPPRAPPGALRGQPGTPGRPGRGRVARGGRGGAPGGRGPRGRVPVPGHPRGHQRPRRAAHPGLGVPVPAAFLWPSSERGPGPERGSAAGRGRGGAGPGAAAQVAAAAEGDRGRDLRAPGGPGQRLRVPRERGAAGATGHGPDLLRGGQKNPGQLRLPSLGLALVPSRAGPGPAPAPRRFRLRRRRPERDRAGGGGAELPQPRHRLQGVPPGHADPPGAPGDPRGARGPPGRGRGAPGSAEPRLGHGAHGHAALRERLRPRQRLPGRSAPLLQLLGAGDPRGGRGGRAGGDADAAEPRRELLRGRGAAAAPPEPVLQESHRAAVPPQSSRRAGSVRCHSEPPEGRGRRTLCQVHPPVLRAGAQVTFRLTLDVPPDAELGRSLRVVANASSDNGGAAAGRGQSAEVAVRYRVLLVLASAPDSTRYLNVTAGAAPALPVTHGYQVQVLGRRGLEANVTFRVPSRLGAGELWESLEVTPEQELPRCQEGPEHSGDPSGPPGESPRLECPHSPCREFLCRIPPAEPPQIWGFRVGGRLRLDGMGQPKLLLLSSARVSYDRSRFQNSWGGTELQVQTELERVETPNPLPLILGASLGGLLLLGLVALGLYKVGFFKRRYKDMMETPGDPPADPQGDPKG